MGFPGGLSGKKFACNAGDLGFIPGLGRSPGAGNGNPLVFMTGYSPWGHKESDMAEATWHACMGVKLASTRWERF